MSHRVRQHLRLEIRAYDETIRRWIPGYERMLERAAAVVASVSPELVLELGAGTGALSAAVLERAEVGAVELLDIDPEMLGRARERLAPHGARARFTLGSFSDPLPPCDAASASLALHHVPRIEERERIHRRVFEALPPGGVFVNVDVMMPLDGPGREAAFDAWIAHMALSGIGEEEARQHFAAWADEDTYFPVEAELAALERAGFEAHVELRAEPTTLLVARKR